MELCLTFNFTTDPLIGTLLGRTKDGLNQRDFTLTHKKVRTEPFCVRVIKAFLWLYFCSVVVCAVDETKTDTTCNEPLTHFEEKNPGSCNDLCLKATKDGMECWGTLDVHTYVCFIII